MMKIGMARLTFCVKYDKMNRLKGGGVMIALTCDNLSLAFGIDTLFERVSFSLQDGDKLGIVGVNGAGKSTLMKMIAGEVSADTGNVFIARDKSIGYLSQNPDFESENTVLGEMMLAFSDLIAEEKAIESMRRDAEEGSVEAALKYSERYESFIKRGGLEYQSRAKSVLQNLGFGEGYHEMPIRSLSGGQKTRVALAKLLLTEPDIIMMDEPTNHLDIENIEWLERFIRQTQKTILVISHDRYFLCKTTNKTLEIENGHAKLYDGNYDVYAAKKKKDREVLWHQFKNQQKEIAHIEASIEQQRRWNREKNIKKAESMQKRLDRMEKISAPENEPIGIRFTLEAHSESGNDVLSVRKLSKAYPVKRLFDEASFEIKKGDRALIVGPNGCGKSTLLKIIYGTVPQSSGYVDYGYNVRVGYYDQEHHNISSSGIVLDEIWNDYDRMTETEVRSLLALFLFRGEDVYKDLSVLSGGEKARISLCKLMLSKVNFLILDEPTNHLDIASREVLEDALMNYDGTILAVSHDRYFINKLSTRILAFDRTEILDFDGNYSEYLSYCERKKADASEETDSKPPVMTNAKAQYLANKQAAAERRKLERRLEKLEKEIALCEKELEDNTLECETTASGDYQRLSELYQRNEELEEALLLMWEERETLKSSLLES